MRKLLKHRKAMSPVIAAIILIAVTVAVSIAVAAWMGALTIGFMATEQLKITDCKFEGIAGEVVGTGDGTLTDFNLAKSPVAPGSETIYLAGVAQPETAYTLDDTTGEITFTSAPASGVVITADYLMASTEWSIVVTAVNTGSAKLVIIDAKVSGLDITDTSLPSDGLPVDAGQKATVIIYAAWVPGTAYDIELVTANGNIFPYRAAAPS